MSKQFSHAMHLDKCIPTDRRRDSIAWCVRALRHFQFDSIAFSGLSGSLIAPSVADRLDKEIMAVRRQNESCHSMNRVEGLVSARRYIIIDDFISSGTSAQFIFERIKDFAPDAVCLGILEYCPRAFRQFMPVATAVANYVEWEPRTYFDSNLDPEWVREVPSFYNPDLGENNA